VERTVRILVQTTTPGGSDDWSVERLSLLTAHLAWLREDGTRFDVPARNREPGPNRDDPVLASLDRSQFDELWLFAFDTGDGLTAADCEGITRFRQRGGGILSTRDHQDMGSSLRTLGESAQPTTFTLVTPSRTLNGTRQTMSKPLRSRGPTTTRGATATSKGSFRSRRRTNCSANRFYPA